MTERKIYQKFKQIITAKEGFSHRLLTNEEKGAFIQFMNVFTYCLNSLKEEYGLILRKTYFEKEYDYWWIDEYCQSSFYRKRFKAINSFVSLFEVKYEKFFINSNVAYNAC